MAINSQGPEKGFKTQNNVIHLRMKKNIAILLLALFLAIGSYAQENEEKANEEKVHKVALVFGYTYIPGALEDGKQSESVYAPTIGLDYFFRFSEKWKIGAVMDLEFATYRIEFESDELERENALVTGILIGYEVVDRWSVLLGPGVEFEKNKNLFILRASSEYEFELGNNWGLFPSFNYDFKKEYSTWSINVGISKSF